MSIEAEILANPERHLAWLQDLLSAPSSSVKLKEFAATLLARIGKPETIAALFNALEDMRASGADISNILRTFDSVTNSEAGSSLVSYAMRANDSRTFATLTSASARCADESLVRDLSARLSETTNAREIFVSQSILQQIPSVQLATEFQQLLGRLTNASSFGFVTAKLGDDGSEASINSLRQAVATANSEQRIMLLDALFRVHSLDSLPYLERLALTDSDFGIRKYAVYALANYPSSASTGVIDRLLADSRASDLRQEIDFVRNLVAKQEAEGVVVGQPPTNPILRR